MNVVERMEREQERVGWIARNERQMRVERVEELGGKKTSGRNLVTMCWWRVFY